MSSKPFAPCAFAWRTALTTPSLNLLWIFFGLLTVATTFWSHPWIWTFQTARRHYNCALLHVRPCGCVPELAECSVVSCALEGEGWGGGGPCCARCGRASGNKYLLRGLVFVRPLVRLFRQTTVIGEHCSDVEDCLRASLLTLVVHVVPVLRSGYLLCDTCLFLAPCIILLLF